MKNLIRGILIVFSLLVVNTTFGQCKNFTKKQCLPQLSPYLSNGQMNSAFFSPGEEAGIEINFNKGLSYRVIVCADPFLENLNYEITDQEGNVYKTDTLSNAYSITDLSVKQTGPLKLFFKVPAKKNATGIVRTGCVTVLIGFKDN